MDQLLYTHCGNIFPQEKLNPHSSLIFEDEVLIKYPQNANQKSKRLRSK